MKKIYILTFHNALNYGAILQCYALNKKLSEFCDCNVIDYRSEVIENRYKVFRANITLKELAKSIILKKRNDYKRKKFSEFIKRNISTTGVFRNIDELRNYRWTQDDAFCVGSDQVWNCELTNNDEAFMLSFVPDFSRKFSYAASFGVELDHSHGIQFIEKLQSFSGISIREKSTYESLKKLGLECTQCIDPVFLLDRKQWVDVSSKVKGENQPFVLLYLLQTSKTLADSAMEYAKLHHKRMVIISTGVKRGYDAEYVSNCGPDEFVRYFYKADAIFTNSFHGISFSILFNKEFYFEYQGNSVKTNSRLRDIIDMFQLQSQNLANTSALDSDIDYIVVEAAIEDKRNAAVKYLINNICD